MSSIGGYLGKTPSNWGTSARSGVWASEDVYYIRKLDQWIKVGTLTVNGTQYDLTSGPVTLSTYGRYTITGTPGMTVKLQLWGAGGGDTTYGGAGGYAAGQFTFDSAQYLVIVGQAGAKTPGVNTSAYPDGGISLGPYASCGGGSTRFGPTVAEANQNNSGTVYHLIAGGGGGGHLYAGGPGGGGGGTSGQSGGGSDYGAGVGGGGTQSAGGTGGVASSYGGTGGAGSKYKGGDGGLSGSYGRGASGGGGYYGGGAGGTVYATGGGGSGYVNSGVISSSVLTAATTTTPVTPAENNRPANKGGPQQDGAVIITLM